MASGWNSYVSFKEESTYGTDPGGARSGYARIVTDGAQVNENFYQAPGMGTRAVRGLYAGMREIDVPLEIETGYEGGWLYLLKHALGGYAFTVNTPVPSANRHTFSAADTLPTGLSIEISKGDIPANKVFLYTGCKVNTLELLIEQDSLMRCNVGLIAREEAPNTTEAAASPTYPTLRPIKNTHYTSLTLIGSSVATVTRARIYIDNKLERYYNLGRYTSEPESSEAQEITFEAEARFENLTHYTKFLAGTEGSVDFLMSSVGEAVYITGTTPYRMQLSGATTHMTGDTPKITGAGVIVAPIKGQIIGTNPTCAFVVDNGQATL
jgi:hypothetical protein